MMEHAAAAGTPFPVVVADAQMPETGACALVQRIKKNRQLAGSIIMMLTSAAQIAETAPCRESVVAACLIKPVKESELLQAVLLALGTPFPKNSAAQAREKSASSERLPRLRILVAEDNPINQKLASRMLEKRGYRVTLVSNGKEALAALEETNFQGHDLVIMDVQMPEMDGLEATAFVREKEKETGRHLPIIALTARAMKGDRELCLAAGMDGYISKPVRGQELIAAIEGQFQPKDAEAPGGPMQSDQVVAEPGHHSRVYVGQA
jgi:two-component system sensor histidine kinase/response regulator